MTNGAPDWETAARRAVASDITEHGEELRDECYNVADRLNEGEPVREEDIEQLQKRIQELEHQIGYLLEPIAARTDAETPE